jgi:hypothetical protein
VYKDGSESLEKFVQRKGESTRALLGSLGGPGELGSVRYAFGKEGDVLDSNRAQPKYCRSAVWTEVDMIPPGQSAAMIAVAGVRAPA